MHLKRHNFDRVIESQLSWHLSISGGDGASFNRKQIALCVSPKHLSPNSKLHLTLTHCQPVKPALQRESEDVRVEEKSTQNNRVSVAH